MGTGEARPGRAALSGPELLEAESLEPVSERVHRRRSLELQQLSAALWELGLRSRLFGQIELGVRPSMQVDFRRRHDPLLSVEPLGEAAPVRVRVHDGCYTWRIAGGAAGNCPTGEPCEAAQRLAAFIAGPRP